MLLYSGLLLCCAICQFHFQESFTKVFDHISDSMTMSQKVLCVTKTFFSLLLSQEKLLQLPPRLRFPQHHLQLLRHHQEHPLPLVLLRLDSQALHLFPPRSNHQNIVSLMEPSTRYAKYQIFVQILFIPDVI